MALEKLPIEIQMRIFRMTPHPLIEMLKEARKKYHAHWRILEENLDLYCPNPPSKYVREYEEMTLPKNLKHKRKQRNKRRCLKPLSDSDSDLDTDSDLEWECDFI